MALVSFNMQFRIIVYLQRIIKIHIRLETCSSLDALTIVLPTFGG